VTGRRAGFFAALDAAALRESHAPLYRALRGALRSMIESGGLAPGEAMPPEREIADRLGISRVTVRQAIAGLVDEGFLVQRRGSGSFVREDARAPASGPPRSRLTSFGDDMASRGRRVVSSWLERSAALATPEEAMALGLATSERVARLHRLRTAEGAPLAVERTSVPARILPDPEAVGASLYAALAARGAAPIRAIQRVRARALPEREAALLATPPGAPALYIERISRDARGSIVEFTRCYYRADAYDFVAELTPPAEEAPA
jgi:GntR family transcriptional regulator